MTVRSATATTRVLAVIIGALLVIGMAGVGIHGSRASRAAGPAGRLPVTVPGGGVALGNGTKLVTEPVDPLSVAVPDGWQSIDVAASTAPAALRALIPQAPALAGLLETESRAAAVGGLRLFAYAPGPQFAYVSVVSFSSPGAAPDNESSAATLDAQMKQVKGMTMSVRLAHLPAGQATQIDATVPAGNLQIVVQVTLFVISGRTIEVKLVAQSATAAPPPAFPRIQKSIRIG